MSVVPISELAQAKRNTAVNISNQGFFVKGTRCLEMAIVNVIYYLVLNCSSLFCKHMLSNNRGKQTLLNLNNNYSVCFESISLPDKNKKIIKEYLFK
jgi:hypothetical protein